MVTWLLLLLILLFPQWAWADIVCDGIDDNIEASFSWTAFASASTGTLVVWYQPTGTPDSAVPGSPNCYDGERFYVIYDGATGAGDIGIYRNGNLSGNDRVCASNWSGSESVVQSPYTNNAWTHLAWVHGAGTLSFYKDGTLVGSVAAGDTQNTAGWLKLCQGGQDGHIPGEGRIAEAKAYPVALSAGQIASEGQSRVHNVIAGAPSGLWMYDFCVPGTSANGVTFKDYSGSGHPMTGNTGGNGTGLTCGASQLSYPWGVW